MILIYEQDLTHYRASFYDYLAQQIEEEILILYGQGEPNSNHIFVESDENRSFNIIQIKRFWIGRSFYFQSLKEVKRIIDKNRISCVVHRGAIRNIGILRELAFFRKQGIPTIVRGKGFSNGREFDPNKYFVDKIHRKIVNSSDVFLCYTEGSKKILDKYCDPTKIFVAVNTLNSDILLDHLKSLQALGKESVKKEIGLSKEKYLVHVGRLTKRKKIDLLIETYEQIYNQHKDVGLIIIGDGPQKKELEELVSRKGLTEVHFKGSMSSESISTSQLIFASDVFVIPGAIGLSVNHAFLLGKPVVGYVIPEGVVPPDDYMHGPEYEYLIHEFNGIVVKEDTPDMFANAIMRILSDKKYSNNALKYGTSYLTVQNMTDGYIRAISVAKHNNIIKK